MPDQTNVTPWWAALTIWAIVNAVNLLQAAGFLSRLPSGSMTVNHALGYVMIAMAVPAAVALVGLAQARVGWPLWAGPATYLAFIVLLVIVDYAWPIEFRSPRRLGILVPYLVLFFGAILLMGLPMFRLNRRLWLVTVATTLLLLVSMVVAIRQGVG